MSLPQNTATPEQSQAKAKASKEPAGRAHPLASRHSAPTARVASLEPVAGWVIDGAGQPMVGVAIHRVDPNGEAGVLVAMTETDGAFRFVAAPAEGEDLMLVGDSVFSAQFRHHSQEKGALVMGTRRMQVSARVLHEGKAVEGALVALHDGSGPRGRVQASNHEGLVYFEDLVPGVYELWAHTPVLASPLVQASRLADEAQVVELVMQTATSGGGRILSREGRGLAALVTLLPLDGNWATREVQSEAGGSFSIDGLLPGRWQVKAQAPGYVESADYVLQAGAEELDLEVQLERGGVAQGRVVDSRGSPVSSARIVLRGKSPTRASPTQAAPLGVPMRWVHPLAMRRHMPLRDSRRFGAARDGLRPAECGHGHCGVDIGTEQGRVVHAAGDARVARVIRDGQGKAGRYVVLEHQGGLKTFYMHLDLVQDDLAGGQWVRAGQPIGTIGRTGVIRSGAHLHFAISQEQGERSWFIDPEPILRHAVVLPFPGRLGDSGPTASEGQSIQVAALVSGTRPALAQEGRVEISAQVVLTDEEGYFRVEGLEAGMYTASAFHSELAPGSSARFFVDYGRETSEVLVRLQPGVEIYGVVRGPEGPIAGASLVAEEGTGLDARSVATVFADTDGRFRVRRLSGPLTLRVSASGYGVVERKLKLTRKDGASTQEESFELASQDRQLTGQVRDPAGFPMRDASVRVVSGPSGRGRRVMTDEYGHFIIANLSPGNYRVEVLSSAYPTGSHQISTEGEHELRLEQGGGIRLRLQDAHSRQSLVGVRVQAFGPEGGRTSVVTDQQGEALLPALQIGSWSLRVQEKGFVHQEREVSVRASEGRSAAFEVMELTRGAALAGILRDANGDRVPGARVWVGASSTTTDQNGRFQLSDVPTGDVLLEAERDQVLGHEALHLAPGDELVTLDLRLD